ncbi:MAG TPA: anthranilate synthase component I family protein [Phycisphaerae bacterium]|nr:anthranilate synthase component I family protein [Phycisphaerae bacterium]
MLSANGYLTGDVHVQRLPTACPPGAMLAPLAACPDPAVLESSAIHKDYGRYTLLACSPLEVLSLRDGVLTDAAGTVLADRDNRALWSVLARAVGAARFRPAEPGAAYLPGWIGYMGYEVGRHVERLPARAVRDTHLPDLRIAFYDALLVYDAVEPGWSLVELVFDRPPPGAGRAGEVLRSIASGASTAAGDPAPAPIEQADPTVRPAIPAESNFTPEQYRAAVARCVEYIAAGDIFQVNLSQRFVVDDAPPALAIYRALRRRNPAWYAGYLRFESGGHPCAIASSSPELFLRVRGDRVVTRPIKGTRPRSGAGDHDARRAAELIASPKDNAELAMIIDLLRNDLGRVCRYGTVRVTDPCRLETHPTVFHLVGTVEGRLCEGVGPIELLRATFPGGSITGAPKIRAMEIIDELEPVARSVYTGCLGIIGVDGSCEWNIAIRTVVCDGSRALVQAGGGIVADSDPRGEYEETLDKARALLEAIAAARAARPLDAPAVR